MSSFALFAVRLQLQPGPAYVTRLYTALPMSPAGYPSQVVCCVSVAMFSSFSTLGRYLPTQ